MGRLAEYLAHRTVLHDPAEAHHRQALGHLRHHAEVVGDEQDAHAGTVLQLAHEAQDLRLHGHVQGGGGFVGDQQVRLAGHGHGDHHPLALAARQAVGKLVDAFLGIGDLHLGQGGDGAFARLGLAHLRAVQAQGLDDLVADGEHRVQRGHGLLEDHGDAAAANGTPPFLGQGQHVHPFVAAVGVAVVEQDLAARMLGDVTRQQLDHRQGAHRLAAARFAHQAEGLAAVDAETHVLHRVDRVLAGAQPGLEVVDFKQHQAFFFKCGSSASRRDSPTRL